MRTLLQISFARITVGLVTIGLASATAPSIAQAQYPPPVVEQTSGQYPVAAQTSGQYPVAAQTSGQYPVAAQTYGQYPPVVETYVEYPPVAQNFGRYPHVAQTYGRYPRVAQTRPMPGGAEVPFSEFEPNENGSTSDETAPAATGDVSYNYTEGAPAVAFEEPAFEEYQAGAAEEGPGAYKNTQYRWYGFIRLDGIYDFKPIASTDSFVTSAIPVPQGEGDNVVLTPRYSRLGWDTSTDLDWSDHDVNTRIEVDFFNGNTSGVFGSYDWRLRFAWVEFGPLLVGQAASVFMDYDVFPNVLDYQGPPGMILMRQGLARIKLPVLHEGTTVSLGVEQPYSDIQWLENGEFVVNPGTGIITDPDLDRNVQDVPDFTSNLRHDGDFGHIQLAGIMRDLSFEPADGSEIDELGYGASLTGAWHPYAWCCGCPPKCCPDDPRLKSRFLAQYAAGHGINRYFQDPNGLGLDAVFTPTDGFEVIDSQGWFISYEQWWASNWASVFSYSEMNVDLPGVLPDDTYEEGRYATANLIWLPFERMGVGLEFLFGERQNKDGQTGEAYRIQSALQYRF